MFAFYTKTMKITTTTEIIKKDSDHFDIIAGGNIVILCLDGAEAQLLFKSLGVLLLAESIAAKVTPQAPDRK